MYTLSKVLPNILSRVLKMKCFGLNNVQVCIKDGAVMTPTFLIKPKLQTKTSLVLVLNMASLSIIPTTVFE